MAKLGVVIFGASRYDHRPELDNPRFAKSASTLRQLVTDKSLVGDRDIGILDFYDAQCSPSEAISKIVDFVKQDDFADIVLYYCGHGDLSHERGYALCLRGTRSDRPASTALKIQDLGQDLKDYVINKRLVLVLDACYAGSAAKEFMDTSLAPILEQQVNDSFPQSGVALLAATEDRDIAKAKSADEFTMFTGGLIEILQSGIQALRSRQFISWREVFEHTRAELRRKYGKDAPTPTITPIRQPDGDVTTVPFFLNRAFGGGHPQRSPKAGADLRNALESSLFDSGQLHCVAVRAERCSPNFVNHVRRALENYSDEIEEAYAAVKAEGRHQNVSPGRSEIPFSTLDVSNAFRSMEEFRKAVIALCRADIVVFDITRLQPGIMVLLGVRSVARRGVTVCSYGDGYVHGQGLALPFNLQMLNVAAHSDSQSKIRNALPLDIIGRKIVNGIKEYASLPNYMDLPSYDAVRGGASGGNDVGPIPRSKKVLVLCPFSGAYEERNWSQALQPELSGKLKARKTVAGRTAKDAADQSGPVLVRLLDVETPRLVAQTLYDLIRRVDMCIVDWTGLRPNVMYELGVRLATNPLGAVHIVERGTGGESAEPSELTHVARMKELFRIFCYDCEAIDPREFRGMVEWFDRGYSAGRAPGDEFEAFRRERSADYTVYETIAECAELDARTGLAASVLDDLLDQARSFVTDDEESTGASRILYHDANPQLREHAETAAIERRIAAWLYIDACYSDEDLAADDEIGGRFRSLRAQIQLWLNKAPRPTDRPLPQSFRSRLAERIDSRKVPRSTAQSTLAGILAEIDELKGEAKVHRDARDVAGAIECLRAAVLRIDESGWKDAPARQAGLVKKVVWQLADCLGMIGGNYRRNGDIQLAIASFERGAELERDPLYRILSSYNSVNAIVSRIESGMSSQSQAGALKQAVALLKRQIFDPGVSEQSRRLDRWAWADLGQCSLLLGDVASAATAYQRFKDLGGAAAAQSSLALLESLLVILRGRNDPAAEAIDAGVIMLRPSSS